MVESGLLLIHLCVVVSTCLCTYMQPVINCTVTQGETEYVQAQLEQYQQTASVWQDKHRDALAELSAVSDQARQHASLAKEYKKDLDGARLQLEQETGRHAELEAHASKLKGELAAAHSDVEQLKSVVLASNRAQSELESRLTSQASDLRAAQSSLQRKSNDITQKDEALEDLQRRLTQSQNVVLQLDSTRDQLQVCVFAFCVCASSTSSST